MENSSFEDYRELIEDINSMAKSKEGFGYKYVELTPLLEEVLPKIHKHNFILVQTIKQTSGEYKRSTREPAVHEDKKTGARVIEGNLDKDISTPAFILHSELIHCSGKKIECDCPLYVDDVDPQAFGSAETYMRRYSIYALLHIKTEDDDGAAASPRAKKSFKEPQTFEDFLFEINKCSSDKQVSALWYKWKVKFKEDSAEYKDLTKFSSNKKMQLQNPSLTCDTLSGLSDIAKEILSK